MNLFHTFAIPFSRGSSFLKEYAALAQMVEQLICNQ